MRSAITPCASAAKRLAFATGQTSACVVSRAKSHINSFKKRNPAWGKRWVLGLRPRDSARIAHLLDRAFSLGETRPDGAPAHLVDIAIFCDSDETHGHAVSYFADVKL